MSTPEHDLQRSLAESAGEQRSKAIVTEVADPLISVVMIFLDAAEFIGEAIESVLAQSYQHWELLLVDDGSTDASTGIARVYARRFPERVRYLEHEGHANRGMGASRNAGLMAARGEFVAFLDADDVYVADRLADHVDALVRHRPVDVVISGELYWWSWYAGAGSRSARPADREFVPPVTPAKVFLPPDLLLIMLWSAGAATPSICSITFRRALASPLASIREAFVGLYEDQLLISQVLLAGRAVVLNRCLARYRQHRRSLTHRAMESVGHRPDAGDEAERKYLDQLREIAVALDCMTPELEAALEWRLRSRGAAVGGGLTSLCSWLRAIVCNVMIGLGTRLLGHEQVERVRSRRVARRFELTAIRVREIERSVLSRRRPVR